MANFRDSPRRRRFINRSLRSPKQAAIVVLTAAAVVLPIVLFFVFTAPWAWSHISPAIPITVGYLALLCLSSLFRASVSDPGTMPRNLHALQVDDFRGSYPSPSPASVPVQTLQISSNKGSTKQEITVKYCETCRIWRPPRSSHCRICDSCIEYSDHHCVWLNNCVGRRNYRYFFAFIAIGSLLAWYMFAVCVVHVVQQHAVSNARESFALVIYTPVVGSYSTTLLTYHCWLLSRGVSTHEHLRNLAVEQKTRPFDRGHAALNLAAVLCRPRGPSYIDGAHGNG